MEICFFNSKGYNKKKKHHSDPWWLLERWSARSYLSKRYKARLYTNFFFSLKAKSYLPIFFCPLSFSARWSITSLRFVRRGFFFHPRQRHSKYVWISLRFARRRGVSVREDGERSPSGHCARTVGCRDTYDRRDVIVMWYCVTRIDLFELSCFTCAPVEKIKRYVLYYYYYCFWIKIRRAAPDALRGY